MRISANSTILGTERVKNEHSNNVDNNMYLMLEDFVLIRLTPKHSWPSGIICDWLKSCNIHSLKQTE